MNVSIPSAWSRLAIRSAESSEPHRTSVTKSSRRWASVSGGISNSARRAGSSPAGPRGAGRRAAVTGAFRQSCSKAFRRDIPHRNRGRFSWANFQADIGSMPAQIFLDGPKRFLRPQDGRHLFQSNGSSPASGQSPPSVNIPPGKNSRWSSSRWFCWVTVARLKRFSASIKSLPVAFDHRQSTSSVMSVGSWAPSRRTAGDGWLSRPNKCKPCCQERRPNRLGPRSRRHICPAKSGWFCPMLPEIETRCAAFPARSLTGRSDASLFHNRSPRGRSGFCSRSSRGKAVPRRYGWARPETISSSAR